MDNRYTDVQPYGTGNKPIMRSNGRMERAFRAKREHACASSLPNRGLQRNQTFQVQLILPRVEHSSVLA